MRRTAATTVTIPSSHAHPQSEAQVALLCVRCMLAERGPSQAACACAYDASPLNESPMSRASALPALASKPSPRMAIKITVIGTSTKYIGDATREAVAVRGSSSAALAKSWGMRGSA
ncbi:hypothetical protein HaLaN_01208 [Haematococcus lacustris]|uniref:Uncharacterized protein n=1 Tax=Haematococcus lacustris TaxID=44745 RepID=A0A699YFE0_HAELA|nr:hypothetical protein HaLaN_01208 [Haematococcus lacustris]